MGPRAITSWYQTAARLWLTLAGLSLLLPPADRRGLWLPLHLALAGAIATAISGAMQNFMLALTATPSPPAAATWVQLALVTVGATGIAVGVPRGMQALTATAGTAFLGAMVLLGWMLWRAWRRSLHKRHAMPLASYGSAIVSVVAGGALGALLGAGAFAGEAVAAARHAHMTLNVLGFASLTVVGTLVTLLPTALRVRMPPWRGRAVLGAFVSGLLLQLLGWATDVTAILAAGGLLYAMGALGLVLLVVTILRAERRWKVPLAAMHMVASVMWFVVGCATLAWALVHGAEGFDDARSTFLVAFVGGWLVQVLLGAWSYLLPMQRPGHPDARRRMLFAFEVAGPLQLALLNAGLVLLALRGAGTVGPGVGDLAIWLTSAGATMALAKAWLFPVLGRGPVDTERARAIWGA